MIRRPAHGPAVLLTGVALVLLSACGVPLQPAAEALPSDIVPVPVTAASVSPTQAPVPTLAPTPSQSSTSTSSRLRLWFVMEDGLVATESELLPGASPAQIVQALVDGPGAIALADGLRTLARDPLTGQPMVTPSPAAAPASSTDPSPAAGPVSVQLGSAFSSLPSAEQVLVLGQVVLSLTGAGAPSVAFTAENGSPLAVPLPDGRLLDRPATVRDFTSLITRP